MPKISIRPPLTIVLTLEGLAASALGCYGCSWNETPAIDRLAGTGTVWDRWTSPLDRPGALVTRWLSECNDAIAAHTRLGTTRFLTDAERMDIPTDLYGFGFVTRVKLDRPEQPAEHFEDTRLLQLAAALLDQVESSTSLVWLHSSTLTEVWDAPIEPEIEPEPEAPLDEAESAELDAANTTEADPPVQLPATCQVPRHQVTSQDDPDLLFAWMGRYAAQVRLLDAVVDSISQSIGGRRVSWVIAGTSGFSLGQNGWIGHRAGPVSSQDVRLPLIVSTGGPLRVPTVQSAAQFPQILQGLTRPDASCSPSQWCRVDEEMTPVIQTESDRAKRVLTCPKWFYVQEEINERLFLKPDDTDDANNIARLRLDVIDELTDAAT